jgi:hypothetical protein
VTVNGKSKITEMFVLRSGMKSWMEGSLKEIWKVGRDGAVRVSAFRKHSGLLNGEVSTLFTVAFIEVAKPTG